MKCKLCPNKVENPKVQKTICADCWEKPFPITTICRIDLAENFSSQEIARFEDEDMVNLADRMADTYIENSFWLDMEIIGEDILEDK